MSPLNSGPRHRFSEFKREHTHQSIAARFEQIARRHGDRLAVKAGARHLTYDDLNRSANRIARALLAEAEARGRPIALLFKQGASLIKGSLGALKAGKIYAQIDYSLPLARARAILEDSQADLLVTDRDNLPFAREIARDAVRVLNIDDFDGNDPDHNLALSIAPERPAFIHYTSGSSGAPKGVVGNHHSELVSIMLKTNALQISPDDRVSLLRSNNVGATSDMLLALLNGAAVVPLELKDQGLAALARWLIDEEITILTCVASVYRSCVRNLSGEERFPELRLIHLGGEPVFESDVELYKKHFNDHCLLVTRLGISETRTATYYFIDKAMPIQNGVVPVGYPLEGYEIQIVDDRGEPLAENNIGEIAIKSEYLADGYWRQPELTRAKFFADPGGSNARTYRTGDLGYLTADGCLVHAGRKDSQVKIRGYRVELSEIERALLALDSIQHAAVIPWDEDRERRSLAAYVVRRHDASVTSREIFAHLKERLPSYMLPSSINFMNCLPLTASGKLDRGALPAPQRLPTTVRYRAPSGAVQHALVSLWSEILAIADIGVDDEFLELGGDSIAAARLISRVNETFLPAQPLKILHEAATISRMARWLAERESAPGRLEKIAAIFLRVQQLGREELNRALSEIHSIRGDG